MTGRQRASVVLITLVAAIAATTGCEPGASSDEQSSETTQPPTYTPVDAAVAATRFLDTYVSDNGRVVRYDQGGDSVSEGQAYAMLVAVAIDDRHRFERIWTWTAANLQRPDGLLSWRWEDGQVVDEEPASDADVLAAWALLEAAERFDKPGYRSAGERMASAIVKHETVEVEGSHALVAGPWARHSSPPFVNPGYFASPAFSELASLTGNEVWNELGATSYDITKQLTSDDALVPDWARVDASGQATAHGKPDSGGEPGVFSLDAARSYVFLAASCDPRDRAVPADMWPFFDDEAENGIAMTYDLDGGRLTDNQHPLTWVAGAASAQAADVDENDADALLAAAAELDDRNPTYYGSAWIALGGILLTTDWLHTC